MNIVDESTRRRNRAVPYKVPGERRSRTTLRSTLPAVALARERRSSARIFLARFDRGKDLAELIHWQLALYG